MKLLNILIKDLIFTYLKWLTLTIVLVLGLDKFGFLTLQSDATSMMALTFVVALAFYASGVTIYSRNYNWLRNLPVTRYQLLSATILFNALNLFFTTMSFFIMLNAFFFEKLFDSLGNYFLVSSAFYDKIFELVTVQSQSINDYPATISVVVLVGGFLFVSSFLFLMGTTGIFKVGNRLTFLHHFVRKFWPNLDSAKIANFEALLIFVSLGLSYVIYRYYSLTVVLAALLCTVIPYVVLKNLTHSLNLKKYYRWVSTPVYGAFVVVISGLIFGHAQYRLNHEQLSAENKAYEALILGPSMYELNDAELDLFLAQDINDQSIVDLIEFAFREDAVLGSFHGAKYGRVWDFKIKRDIGEFEKIIESKTRLDALEASLGLFEPHDLGMAEIKLYFEKAANIENSEHSKRHGKVFDYHSVAKYLSWRDFKREELAQMLSSRNSWLHRLALENIYVAKNSEGRENFGFKAKAREMSDKVKFDLTDVIVKNFDLYDSIVLKSASDVISAAQCRSISSVDVLKNAIRGNSIASNLNCHKYEEASDWVQKQNFYLDGEYLWKLKSSLQN